MYSDFTTFFVTCQVVWKNTPHYFYKIKSDGSKRVVAWSERVNTRFLFIEEFVKDASALTVSVEEETYDHDRSKYEEIVECLYLVRVECAEDHEEAGEDGEYREYKSLDGIEVL